MQIRTRVGVLIFKNKKILLIKHVDPDTETTWWCPPGGGIEGNESLFAAAKREVFEESGLHIEVDKPVYLRQYISTTYAQNNFDVYVTAKPLGGKETIKNIKGKGGDEHFIKEWRYFSQEELVTITVYPSILKDVVWTDLDRNFPHLKFIGIQGDGD